MTQLDIDEGAAHFIAVYALLKEAVLMVVVHGSADVISSLTEEYIR